jgi:hypothetical protein
MLCPVDWWSYQRFVHRDAFIFNVSRCQKKQLQTFQGFVVPPSSESPIPSGRDERFKGPYNVTARRPEQQQFSERFNNTGSHVSRNITKDRY